ncbi:MAG: transposase, partial [Opitutaceae bacterium]|nr:transposase [Opitutaceae bacterium]
MPRKKCSEEQIIYALRSVEGGAKIGEVCRQLGVSEQSYFRWKRQYGGLGVSELKELRQLREENSSLKRLVADFSLDKRMLQEVLAKKSEACTQAPDRRLAKGD